MTLCDRFRGQQQQAGFATELVPSSAQHQELQALRFCLDFLVTLCFFFSLKVNLPPKKLKPNLAKQLQISATTQIMEMKTNLTKWWRYIKE